jgi:hypothetical protein
MGAGLSFGGVMKADTKFQLKQLIFLLKNHKLVGARSKVDFAEEYRLWVWTNQHSAFKAYTAKNIFSIFYAFLKYEYGNTVLDRFCRNGLIDIKHGSGNSEGIRQPPTVPSNVEDIIADMIAGDPMILDVLQDVIAKGG